MQIDPTSLHRPWPVLCHRLSLSLTHSLAEALSLSFSPLSLPDNVIHLYSEPESLDWQ